MKFLSLSITTGSLYRNATVMPDTSNWQPSSFEGFSTMQAIVKAKHNAGNSDITRHTHMTWDTKQAGQEIRGRNKDSPL